MMMGTEKILSYLHRKKLTDSEREIERDTDTTETATKIERGSAKY